MPDERGVCYKPPLQIRRLGRASAPRKNAEIAIYCMNTDCSASREEARELRELGYVEGKEVWMRAARRGQARPGLAVHAAVSDRTR